MSADIARRRKEETVGDSEFARGTAAFHTIPSVNARENMGQTDDASDIGDINDALSDSGSDISRICLAGLVSATSSGRLVSLPVQGDGDDDDDYLNESDSEDDDADDGEYDDDSGSEVSSTRVCLAGLLE